LAPDFLLASWEVIPQKNSPRVNSADRVGGIAMYGQGTVGNYIDGETERVTSLKIRFKLKITF